MKKKVLSLLLTLVLMLGCLPMAAGAAEISGTCGENLTWTLSDEGVLTISGSEEMENYDDAFPDGEHAPWHAHIEEITSVVINEGVTTIGNYAFSGYTRLTSVTIPASVTTIGTDAFCGCSGLTSVTIPEGVTTIGSGAFFCCNLTSITIPASVTNIGDCAFSVFWPDFGHSNLKKAIFMGNAPICGYGVFTERWAASVPIPNFCIYYQPNAVGWTTPEWTAGGDTYPCKPISEDPDQPNKTEDEILTEQAQEYGLLDYLGTTVDLNAAVTRLDVAKLLADFVELEVNEADADSLTFTDCDSLTTEEKAMLYALCEAGYIAGYSDNSFGPENNFTRCEAATMIGKMLNVPLPKRGGYFTDVPDSAWYAKFINSLYETGVFTTEKETFIPLRHAETRDVLRWLVAAHEKKVNGAVSTISLTGATTVKVGEAVTLTANTSPSGLKYNWNSSDETVATVSNGRVSGVKAGSATIIVRLANGNSATVNVRISAASTGGSTSGAPSDDEPVVETSTTESGNLVTTTTQPNGDQELKVETPTGETIANIKLPADPGKGKEFADVKSGAWYEGAVDKATAYGLFGGTSETAFEPGADMNRGMLAQVLYNLSGKTRYGMGEGTFTDVKNGAWYANAVDWAAKVGVTSGTGSGGFSPNQSITREQLVTMLYNYAKAIGMDRKSSAGLERFPDAGKVSGYAKEAMQWAVAEGFISGRADNGESYIAPQGTATRAEVAAVLVKFTERLK